MSEPEAMHNNDALNVCLAALKPVWEKALKISPIYQQAQQEKDDACRRLSTILQESTDNAVLGAEINDLLMTVTKLFLAREKTLLVATVLQLGDACAAGMEKVKADAKTKMYHATKRALTETGAKHGAGEVLKILGLPIPEGHAEQAQR